MVMVVAVVVVVTFRIVVGIVVVIVVVISAMEPGISTSVLEAEAEAVVFVSRFQIGGWDSY